MLTAPAESLGIYDAFLAHATPDRLQKLLARNELFQRTLHLPGDIVECGVFKGSGIYTWAKLQAIFQPNCEKKIVGFDFFESARDSEFRFAEDQACLEEHAVGWSPRAEIEARTASWGVHGVELVAGDVVRTTAEWAAANLGARIRLLYLDVDNYEGSVAILRHLEPLVVRGGIIAFDEYAYRGYGEADAVDEFLAERPGLELRTIPWANTPTAYVVKP